jgi:hypothetical protein
LTAKEIYCRQRSTRKNPREASWESQLGYIANSKFINTKIIKKHNLKHHKIRVQVQNSAREAKQFFGPWPTATFEEKTHRFVEAEIIDTFAVNVHGRSSRIIRHRFIGGNTHKMSVLTSGQKEMPASAKTAN